MLKKQALIIAIFYTLGLAVVSLITISNLPDAGISFADKIFHFIVYGVLTYLWVNTFFFKFKWSKVKAITYASVLSVVFGIIIEVLQGSVTTSRFMDVYDALANTLGVLVMVLVLLLNKKTLIKNL